ncbi:hypothetical protein NUW58_g6218 [Xylaria curta]|uniref:Uncharacterized protein n=1 Tax=Xylaria curta TaxID=42375 RepID=A0ACC1NWI5_9PEZI|nr:hypothetical protein NUW58_g6218 [Xylaria curta]
MGRSTVGKSYLPIVQNADKDVLSALVSRRSKAARLRAARDRGQDAVDVLLPGLARAPAQQSARVGQQVRGPGPKDLDVAAANVLSDAQQGGSTYREGQCECRAVQRGREAYSMRAGLQKASQNWTPSFGFLAGAGAGARATGVGPQAHPCLVLCPDGICIVGVGSLRET